MSDMTTHPSPSLPPAPYPGLRPFERSEAEIFFGRAGQVNTLLTRLETQRFLAVVGASGSGKSSLVRAGLLPALEQGMLFDAGDQWRMVIVRPGRQPLTNLARELLQVLRPHADRSPPDVREIALLQSVLRSGPQGLLQAVRDSALPSGTNVLVLVDQFEEIFRFRHQEEGTHSTEDGSSRRRDDAAVLVDLLLQTSAQRDRPIYTAVTMRSDFLGDCDAFHGLPAAIDRSQFLTPRLTRDELRDAILGPAQKFACTVEEELVTRVLNDIGDDPDQLPLMQHAVMRVWSRAASRPNDSQTLRLADYDAIGGMDEALSRHADEIYQGLGDASRRRLCQVMFRCLSDRSAERRLTRRLATVGEVAAVAGESEAKVIEVADRFRAPGCNFLMPPPDVPLSAETTLDISHESLLRKWRQLHGWLEKEAEWAKIYTRLSETARSHYDRDEAGLYRPPELMVALQWRKTAKPTAAWAARYDDNFAQSMRFLGRSALWRNIRLALGITAVSLFVVLGIVSFFLSRRAETSRKEAEQNRTKALEAWFHADKARTEALEKKGEAEEAKQQTRKLLDVSRVSLAFKALQNGDLRGAQENLGADEQDIDHSAHGWDWRYLRHLTDLALWTWPDPAAATAPRRDIAAMAFHDAGRKLVQVARDAPLVLLDVRTGAPVPGDAPDFPASSQAAAIDQATGRIAVADATGSIRIWRPDDGRLSEPLPASGKSVAHLAFTADGKRLVAVLRKGEKPQPTERVPGPFQAPPRSGTVPGPARPGVYPAPPQTGTGGAWRVAVLDVERRAAVAEWVSDTADEFAALAVSPTGRWIVVSRSGPVDASAPLVVLDAVSGKQVSQSFGDPVSAMTFHPGGRWLFVGTESGQVQILRLSPGGVFEKFTVTEEQRNAEQVTRDVRPIRPEGSRTAPRQAAVGGAVRSATADRHRIAQHERRVTAVACAADGALLVSGGEDGRVAFLDLLPLLAPPWEADPFVTRYGPQETEDAQAVSPPAASAMSSRPTGLQRDNPCIVRRPVVRADLPGHAAPIRHIAFHPNDGLLASIDNEGETKLWCVWRVDTDQFTLALNGAGAALALDPLGRFVVEAESIRTNLAPQARFWDVTTGARLDDKQPDDQRAKPGGPAEAKPQYFGTVLQVSRDGQVVTGGGIEVRDDFDDKRIALAQWEATTWKEKPAPASGLKALEMALGPAGGLFALRQGDRLTGWQLAPPAPPQATAGLRLPLPREDRFWFVSSGHLVVASAEGLALVEPATGKRTVLPESLPDQSVRRVLTNEHTKRLFACYGSQVLYWDYVTPEEPESIRQYDSEIIDMAVSPDGRLLFLLIDGAIQVRDVSTKTTVMTLRAAYRDKGAPIDAPLSMADPAGVLVAPAGLGRVHIWESPSAEYLAASPAVREGRVTDALDIGDRLKNDLFASTVIRTLLSTDAGAGAAPAVTVGQLLSSPAAHAIRDKLRLLRGCELTEVMEKQRQLHIVRQLLSVPGLPPATCGEALRRARLLASRFEHDDNCRLLLGLAQVRNGLSQEAEATLQPLSQPGAKPPPAPARQKLATALRALTYAREKQWLEAWQQRQRLDGIRVGAAPQADDWPADPQEMAAYRQEVEQATRVEIKILDFVQRTTAAGPRFDFRVEAVCPAPAIAEQLKVTANVAEEPTARTVDGSRVELRWADATLPPNVPYAGLRVTAADADSTTTVATAVHGFRKLHYLLTGVGAYKKLPRLQGPANDVAELERVLEASARGLYELGHQKTLPDAQFTQKTITDEIAALQKELASANRDDLLIVSYSGMELLGQDDFLFSTVDSDPKTRDTAVSWSQQLRKLANVPCRVVFIIDTCHSGKIASLESSRQPPLPANAVVLMSCQAEEVCFERVYRDRAMGQFTAAVASGLLGGADTCGDGIVQLDELYDYVRVSSAMASQRQNPAIFPPLGANTRNLPLSRVTGEVAPGESPLSASTSR